MNGIFRQSAVWRKREIKTNVSFMAKKLKKRYSFKNHLNQSELEKQINNRLQFHSQYAMYHTL